MKTFIVFLAFFALALAGPSGKWSKDGKGGKGKFAPREFKCNGEDIKFPEELKTTSQECDAKIFGENPQMNKENIDKFKAMSKDEKKEMFKKMQTKMACANICKGKALGVINEDGKLNKEAWSGLIEKALPSSVTQDLIAATQECIDAQPDLIFSEENCEKDAQNYEKLMKCAGSAAMKACKVEPMPEDDN